MRLIDADALREVLADCAAEGQLTEREARALTDAAPTVVEAYEREGAAIARAEQAEAEVARLNKDATTRVSMGLHEEAVGEQVARAEKAEAEVRRLRVCGNCLHIELAHSPSHDPWSCEYRLECDAYFPDDDGPRDNDWPHGKEWGVVNFGDPCHVTPSRWKERAR